MSLFKFVARMMATLAVVTLAPVCGALAQESSAEFFARDRGLWVADQSRPPSKPAQRGRAAPQASAFAAVALRLGVPPLLALATIRVESRGNCFAIGAAGELGPLQIKPATARMLGYAGPTSALRSCGAGLEWGMRHLALAYRRCGTAVLHNKGLGGSCSPSSYSRRVALAMGR